MARGSLARIRSDKGVPVTLLPPKQLPSNDQTLNLARAFADRAEFHVAKVLLCRIVLHESVAAVDLHALFGRTDGDFTGIEFRDRRFERRPLNLSVFHPCSAIRQQ